MSGILVIGVLGLVLQKLVRILENYVSNWQDIVEG